MKKKNTARDNVNLFFSAFLIIAYIVCGYFFSSFAGTLAGAVAQSVVTVAIVAVFGLLIFYATRVGEGKTVKRLSIVTLVLLDLPTLYIILAFVISALPFHRELVEAPLVAYMAALAFGYGVPYTFISGFETVSDEEESEAVEEETTAVEGGIEEELSEAEPVAAEQSYEPDADEIVVEGTAVIENIDEYVSEDEETEDPEE